MLVNLKSEGKAVVIFGGGSEGYRKTSDFVAAGAKVLVVSRSFSAGIRKLEEEGRISLRKAEVEDAEAFVKNLKPKPDVLVAVTSSRDLNAQLIGYGKSVGCMVYAPDNPASSDFVLPATARVGDVRIAISTDGRSPAMARVLRQRIERMITQQDLLQIKLQEHAREFLKRRVPDQKVRRQLLYEILDDETIRGLLLEGKLIEAQKAAAKIIENYRKDVKEAQPE